MSKPKILLSFYCNFALCLAGCAGAPHDLYETAKIAVMGQPDVELSPQALDAIPYANAYLQVGESPRALVVLAFAEQGELKWASADKYMFVTQDGRLIKTLGLPTNLRSISAATQDPLSSPASLTQSSFNWQWQAEWDQDYRSVHSMQSQFENQGMETIDINGQAIALQHVVETVEDQFLDRSYQNHYWREPTTGLVRHSTQQLGVDLPVLEMTILKPYQP
jgi:hypothetical protein